MIIHLSFWYDSQICRIVFYFNLKECNHDWFKSINKSQRETFYIVFSVLPDVKGIFLQQKSQHLTSKLTERERSPWDYHIRIYFANTFQNMTDGALYNMFQHLVDYPFYSIRLSLPITDLVIFVKALTNDITLKLILFCNKH